MASRKRILVYLVELSSRGNIPIFLLFPASKLWSVELAFPTIACPAFSSRKNNLSGSRKGYNFLEAGSVSASSYNDRKLVGVGLQKGARALSRSSPPLSVASFERGAPRAAASTGRRIPISGSFSTCATLRSEL